MSEIRVGAWGEHRLLVTPEVSIDFLGLEPARVLSTPHMIGFMELTSRTTLKPFLDKNHDSVGTMVNIRHLAGAPLGSAVRFRAEILQVSGSRVLFSVDAWDEKEKIGEGTHERTIINIAKFGARLAAKSGIPA